jgi:hypothetical protein
MRPLYFCGVLPSGGKMLRAILFYTPAVREHLFSTFNSFIH